MEVKKETNPNCQAIGRQAADTVSSGLICRASAELCCVKQLQESVCAMGMSVAMYVYTILRRPKGKTTVHAALPV